MSCDKNWRIALVPPQHKPPGVHPDECTWNAGEGGCGEKYELNETVTTYEVYTPESQGLTIPISAQAQNFAYIALLSSVRPWTLSMLAGRVLSAQMVELRNGDRAAFPGVHSPDQ
jgi:hypothetical protein